MVLQRWLTCQFDQIGVVSRAQSKTNLGELQEVDRIESVLIAQSPSQSTCGHYPCVPPGFPCGCFHRVRPPEGSACTCWRDRPCTSQSPGVKFACTEKYEERESYARNGGRSTDGCTHGSKIVTKQRNRWTIDEHRGELQDVSFAKFLSAFPLCLLYH